jgi:hypothetical protein
VPRGQDGSDVVIRIDVSNSVTSLNASLGDLTAGDFIF